MVASRLHWVLAEAIGAAATLCRRTGEAQYERWYRTFWDEAVARYTDRDPGSWVHELPVGNSPSVWSGKPDVYHAYQAVLVPQLALAPVLAEALRAALERTDPVPRRAHTGERPSMVVRSFVPSSSSASMSITGTQHSPNPPASSAPSGTSAIDSRGLSTTLSASAS